MTTYIYAIPPGNKDYFITVKNIIKDIYNKRTYRNMPWPYEYDIRLVDMLFSRGFFEHTGLNRREYTNKRISMVFVNTSNGIIGITMSCTDSNGNNTSINARVPAINQKN